MLYIGIDHKEGYYLLLIIHLSKVIKFHVWYTKILSLLGGRWGRTNILKLVYARLGITELFCVKVVNVLCG